MKTLNVTTGFHFSAWVTDQETKRLVKRERNIHKGIAHKEEKERKEREQEIHIGIDERRKVRMLRGKVYMKERGVWNKRGKKM